MGGVGRPKTRQRAVGNRGGKRALQNAALLTSPERPGASRGLQKGSQRGSKTGAKTDRKKG